jgi:hypothetical protein
MAPRKKITGPLNNIFKSSAGTDAAKARYTAVAKAPTLPPGKSTKTRC